MTRTTILAGLAAILVVASVLPATAYHIDGRWNAAGTAAGSGLTDADWAINTGGVTACESAGAMDDRNPQGDHRWGINGLCTTGQNDATGSTAAVAPAVVTAPAAAGTYVKLDICDAITADSTAGAARNVGQGPYAFGGGACAAAATGSRSLLSLNTPGRTDAHGFTGRVGAFTCFVPTHLEPVPIATVDYALYYDALYAWWSYNGNPTPTFVSVPDERLFYTPGDPVGGIMTGNGQPPPFDGSRNQDAFHGHATVFPDLSASEILASPIGSVETTNVIPAGAFVGLSDDSFAAAGGLSNNCDDSPSCGPSPMAGPSTVCGAPYGPVIRAPSGGIVRPHVLPACMQYMNGFLDAAIHTFGCLTPCAPPVVGAAAAVALNLPPPARVGQTVVGNVRCAGINVAGTTATAVLAPAGPVELGAAAGGPAVLAPPGVKTCVRTGGNAPMVAPGFMWAVICTPP